MKKRFPGYNFTGLDINEELIKEGNSFLQQENIYSLPRVENFFFENGYQVFKSIPFEIDIDLPKPEHSKMQTYTQKIVDENKRLQISGPLLMSWVFIYAAKKPL